MTSNFLTYCKSGFVSFVGTLVVFFVLPSFLTAQTQKEEIDNLVEYLESQMLLAPDHAETAGLSPRWIARMGAQSHAGGQREKFLRRLERSVDARVNEHVTDNPEVSVSFKCEAYIRLLDAMQMTSGNPGSLSPYPDHGRLAGSLDRSPDPGRAAWYGTALRFLAENIDHDGVFETYKNLSWPTKEAHHAGEIVKTSRKNEIRAWACDKRIWVAVSELSMVCKADIKVADNEFDNLFDEVSQLFELAVDELADEPVDIESLPTLKEVGLSLAKSGVIALDRERPRAIGPPGTAPGNFDETRKNKVLALCRRVLEK